MKKLFVITFLSIMTFQARANSPVANQSLRTDGFPLPAQLQKLDLGSVDVVGLMAGTRKLLKPFTSAKGIEYRYNNAPADKSSKSYAEALKVAASLLTKDGTVQQQACGLESIKLSAAGVSAFTLACGFGVNYEMNQDPSGNVTISFGYGGGDGSGYEGLVFKGTIEWKQVAGQYQYVFTPKSVAFEYNGGS